MLFRSRQGVAVPTLNRNTFSQINVLVPSCEEQKEIVHILDMIEMREHVAAKHKERLQELFANLLDSLMTSRLRAT